MDENMPDSIPEEGEDPKERRKSLSISSLRKGLMRRWHFEIESTEHHLLFLHSELLLIQGPIAYTQQFVYREANSKRKSYT